MFITAGITSLCEQELKIVRAVKTCYAGRTLPIPDLKHSMIFTLMYIDQQFPKLFEPSAVDPGWEPLP